MKFCKHVVLALSVGLCSLEAAPRGDGEIRVVLDSLSPSTSGTTTSYALSGNLVSAGGLGTTESYQNYGDIVSTTAGVTIPSIISLSVAEASGTENDGIVVVGQPLTLMSEVRGSELLYQWLFKAEGSEAFEAQDGSTGSSLAFEAALNSSGEYVLEVSNSAGTVVSDPVLVTVYPAIEIDAITSDPATAVVLEGTTVTLSVTGEIPGEPTYQWFSGADAIEGATEASLVIDSISVADAGSYMVTVGNEAGDSVNSDPYSLTVLDAIALEPIAATPSAVVGVGAEVALTASGHVPGTAAYQWEFNGIALDGETGSVLTISSASLDDAGSYSVVVTNEVQTATESIDLEVYEAPELLAVVVTPSSAVLVGTDLQMVASVAGYGSLSYQWSKDGVPIEGATASLLSISEATISNSGSYTLTVTDGLGQTATSESVEITVSEPSAIPAPAALASATLVDPDTNEYLSDWFGTFYTLEETSPIGTLIYSEEQGYIAIAEGSITEDEFWYYDFGFKNWLSTAKGVYPFAYELGNNWQFYAKDISLGFSQRWFYDYGSESWEARAIGGM